MLFMYLYMSNFSEESSNGIPFIGFLISYRFLASAMNYEVFNLTVTYLRNFNSFINKIFQIFFYNSC